MSNTSQIESVDLTATPLVTISGHEDKIWGIAYIPQASGKRVVTCSHDKTVRIWDAESGEQEGTSMEHELGVVYGLAVTRDGQRILSGGVDKRIDVWDVETHELIEEWESHTGSILSITLSPDDRLAASGDSDGKLVIWEIKEGSGIKHSIETGTGWVLSICFSPNGEKIACAARKSGNYTIQIFDVESGELILGSIYHEDWVRCVIWSLDGTKLFSASNDHTIRCWNSETAEPVGQPWTGHMDCVTWLSLSPDGKRLASTSLDQTVRFWDAHSGDPVGRPLQHDDHLMRVTFSPSGEFVASGMVNGKISVWRVPWWDDSQLEKELHKSLLDLPAVPVPKILSNGQQQRELDYLDLPTNRRPIASSHRPPADSATGHVQRFWRRLVTRHSASSPAQQALEHHPIRHRRFWKLSVGTPVTEVAAGHAKNVTLSVTRCIIV
ncbi:WD40 repeat-like protein [Paxillus ammoniavirescens]|nr:WD40 repeat-like protein [Paxillus ammoniavirescens]